jgi:hypothetical protein
MSQGLNKTLTPILRLRLILVWQCQLVPLLTTVPGFLNIGP